MSQIYTQIYTQNYTQMLFTVVPSHIAKNCTLISVLILFKKNSFCRYHLEKFHTYFVHLGLIVLKGNSDRYYTSRSGLDFSSHWDLKNA